ncbi:type I restriction/modification system, S subunit [Campylobacter coli]|nr:MULTISPECIES: restriction endonuclease subunit S [Campylobacter]AOH50221.1 type I restriction/modification system, S subunit [Campylobacter coli]RTJ36419.1 restriction endonuclease subunit S [Campylobacter jejuni]RTJ60890.1 restriction endonuclease subunit S [Campylobacter jejuni]RTK06164.1 restriction endonuclease subunit S [Campylobacter jejuni]
MKNFKDSGIEWLGEIPQDWKVKRLRYIGYVFGGLVGKTSKDFSDEYIKGFKPYITFKNVCDNTIINFNKIEYVNINDLEKQNKVIKNDILFLQSSETLDEIGKSAIYLNDEEIYLNTFCKGFRIKNSAFPIFLNYLFNSLTYKKYFISNCSGFTRINLRQEHLLDIPLILPPLKEQEQIANFLDEKCEKIKNFIEKKEKLISLLKEQKQALINETITKGLNKNVNFKDSGIEWLGEIPQDWKVKRLRYIGYVFGGLVGKTSKDFSDEYIKGFKPYITFKNVCDNTIINFNKIEYVNINDLEKQNKVIKNDILFLQSSETLDEIGKSAIYLNDEEIYLNTFCKGFRIKNSAFPIFLNYLFNSLTYKKYFISNCSGFTRINLRQEHLLDIPLILPPLKEQEQIANFLDEKCEKIDLLIEKTEKQIKLIKEYKTTLINQAVCGRIDL